MKEYTLNGIRIVEVPVKDFKVIMTDKDKKKAGYKNYCNAGFFAPFREQGSYYTLPVAHVKCDFESANRWCKHYCETRGEFNGNKFTFDASKFYHPQFSGKSISTLVTSNGKAEIVDLVTLSKNYDYAISGVPVMRHGLDVKFKTYVTGQGWEASSLYATWHVFIGLKVTDKSIVYVMSYKTKTSNLIYKAEMFSKFLALGFTEVIKLDGGGSFYFKTKNKTQTYPLIGTRHINTIIDFGDIITSASTSNPFPVPTRTLRKTCKGNDVRWLQWQLNAVGNYGLAVDGSFGPSVYKAVKLYQTYKGLEIDGIVGPMTLKSLLNESV